MEQFKSLEGIATVETRLERMRDERLKMSDLIGSEMTKDQIITVYKELSKKIVKVLGEQERAKLNSLSDEDFDLFIEGIGEQYINMETFELDDIPPITLDHFNNIENYRRVFGYGHPDLIAREKTNPTPTVQELLMGCYIEQIEQQTQSAVLVLREKGYNTVQSGYENYFTGSQFFHLQYTPEITIPQELIISMKKDFDVDAQIKHMGKDIYIELIPSRVKSISEWKECLDYFSQNMPVIGQEKFASLGSALDFSVEIIERFPVEEILKSARNDKEIALIQKLYECKNKDEIYKLRKEEAVN